jgi:S1-C subfamily serine protease
MSDQFNPQVPGANTMYPNRAESVPLPNDGSVENSMQFQSNSESSSSINSTKPVYAPQPYSAQKPMISGTQSSVKAKTPKKKRTIGLGALFLISLLLLALSGLTGFLGALGGYAIAKKNQEPTSRQVVNKEPINVSVANENSETVNIVDKTIDSVVSIVATKELMTSPVFGDDFGTNSTETQRVSAGTGFVVQVENSGDVYGITNRHVVDEKQLEYVAIFSDGKQTPVQVIARDDIIDVAFFKFKKPTDKEIKPIDLGSSEGLKPGQSVIAIGYSLGEFSNTVSKGIVSGLDRSIVAQGNGQSQLLEGIIQTDASINSGNSGGPLIDLTGKVVGVNVAKAGTGENIGFSVPIDSIIPLFKSVVNTGKIAHPFLGIRYQTLNPQLATKYKVDQNYGALIIAAGNTEVPIVKDGPADKAGLKEKDIILGIDDKRITASKGLQSMLRSYRAGESIDLVIWRDGKEQKVPLVLGERIVQQ